MASGILGQTNITAQSTWTSVYTVPSSKVATLNIGIVNLSTSTAIIRIALAANTSPVDSQMIEYDFNLAGNDVFERGGLVMQAAQKVVVQASSVSPNISVIVTGYEE